MDSRDILLRIESKIDKLDDRQSASEILQAEMKKDLKYHIRRTDLLEEAIKPVQEHVSTVNAGLKLLGVLAVIAAIGEGIIKAIEFIKGIK